MDNVTTQARTGFVLNGQPVSADTPPGEALSHTLRERLGARDVKVGCAAGDCGACTVLLDGEPVCACLTPTARTEGRKVETLHEVWPNLQLFVHGGVTFAPYADRCRVLVGKDIRYTDTYSASEGGMLGVQDRVDDPGMLPLLDRSTFFEFVPGDEVYASPSLIRNGAYADFVCVDARLAARKPGQLDHVHAAALPLVTLTAWEGLVDRARIEAGENVLIQAGAGGVGHIAIQIAKMHGARVMATAGTPEKLEKAVELGADHVIDYKQQDFGKVVRELTAKRGVDIIVDHVGGENISKSLRSLARGGRVVTCGATSSARR